MEDDYEEGELERSAERKDVSFRWLFDEEAKKEKDRKVMLRMSAGCRSFMSTDGCTAEERAGATATTPKRPHPTLL